MYKWDWEGVCEGGTERVCVCGVGRAYAKVGKGGCV